MVQNEWYAYEHVNGCYHLKRYIPDSYADACASDFVKRVLGPWPANSRDEAEQKLKALLEKEKQHANA